MANRLDWHTSARAIADEGASQLNEQNPNILLDEYRKVWNIAPLSFHCSKNENTCSILNLNSGNFHSFSSSKSSSEESNQTDWNWIILSSFETAHWVIQCWGTFSYLFLKFFGMNHMRFKLIKHYFRISVYSRQRLICITTFIKISKSEDTFLELQTHNNKNVGW